MARTYGLNSEHDIDSRFCHGTIGKIYSRGFVTDVSYVRLLNLIQCIFFKSTIYSILPNEVRLNDIWVLMTIDVLKYLFFLLHTQLFNDIYPEIVLWLFKILFQLKQSILSFTIKYQLLDSCNESLKMYQLNIY